MAVSFYTQEVSWRSVKLKMRSIFNCFELYVNIWYYQQVELWYGIRQENVIFIWIQILLFLRIKFIFDMCISMCLGVCRYVLMVIYMNLRRIRIVCNLYCWKILKGIKFKCLFYLDCGEKFGVLKFINYVLRKVCKILCQIYQF